MLVCVWEVYGYEGRWRGEKVQEGEGKGRGSFMSGFGSVCFVGLRWWFVGGFVGGFVGALRQGRGRGRGEKGEGWVGGTMCGRGCLFGTRGAYWFCRQRGDDIVH